MTDILHDADFKVFNDVDGHVRVAPIYRDSDQDYDLLIYMKVQRDQLVAAEVRKTNGVSRRSEFLPVTSFDVMCALVNFVDVAKHASRYPDCYVFSDILRESVAFHVKQEDLERLLEAQKAELGPVEIPAFLKELEREAREANGREATTERPPASRAQTSEPGEPNGSGVRRGIGNYRRVDDFLSQIDDQLSQVQTPQIPLR